MYPKIILRLYIKHFLNSLENQLKFLFNLNKRLFVAMSLEIYEQYKFFIYLGGHVKKQTSYR